MYKFINYIIALVWLINGLYCKVLNGVPRHQEIVAEILGQKYSGFLIVLIGIAEIIMAVWIVSNYKSRLCAMLQILVVAIMNILEFILVPELLLWGKLNAVFALGFMILVYINEFFIRPKAIVNQ